VATHSAQFILGCLHSGIPINIIRLTFKAGVATARVLPSSDVAAVMRAPLLRSVGAVSGLFHEHVVVVESDTDRAFYQEVNERLLKFDNGRGIANCLFLNAQSWQTIRRIMAPLRQMGIPAACIYDLDVVLNGGSEWTQMLRDAAVPEVQINSLLALRAAIALATKECSGSIKRSGISILAGSNREALENLLSELARYGIFFVPVGECEAWLKHLKIDGHATEWLVRMFETLGDDPKGAQYAKPEAGDVWDFIATVRAWLSDPRRKGIPS
jgi:hypothetical protein